MKPQQNKLIIFSIAFVAMIFIGNFLIDNPYTHSIANYYLNEKIVQNLPIHAEYQSMRIELFPPGISVYGVKVTHQSKDSPDVDFFSLSTVTLKVSLWAVLMSRQQLGDLELKDLSISWPPPPRVHDGAR